MHPDSIVLVIGLLALSAGTLVLLFRVRHLAVRIVGGLLVMVLSATAGIAVVNDYYGYYQTWSQLRADLTGSYSHFTTAPIGSRAVAYVDSGSLQTLTLPGRRSGITRSGLVYLPPQYTQARYARTRFPVVELLHGTPGAPSAWPEHLEIESVMNELIAHHLAGPMILVMPTMSVGTHYQECVDAPGALDDTYITDDVRADILHRFRASADPAQWGIAGYSSGGYCAANLALRHRSDFGAAAVMDGYFRPTDGPAAAALHHDPVAEAANNPLLAARRLRSSTAPLPAFWLSAGTGDAADFAAATAFSHALHGVERVTLYREPGAGHNFYAWKPDIPRVLPWMWQQLATPDLSVRFPGAGSVTTGVINAPGAKPGHHRRH